MNVLNLQTETFETTLLEVQLESLDGNVKTTINTFTAKQVTGNMKVIDWGKHAAKCTHFKGIQFPKTGIRPIVDLLMGITLLVQGCSRSTRGTSSKTYTIRMDMYRNSPWAQRR